MTETIYRKEFASLRRAVQIEERVTDQIQAEHTSIHSGCGIDCFNGHAGNRPRQTRQQDDSTRSQEQNSHRIQRSATRPIRRREVAIIPGRKRLKRPVTRGRRSHASRLQTPSSTSSEDSDDTTHRSHFRDRRSAISWDVQSDRHSSTEISLIQEDGRVFTAEKSNAISIERFDNVIRDESRPEGFGSQADGLGDMYRATPTPGPAPIERSQVTLSSPPYQDCVTSASIVQSQTPSVFISGPAPQSVIGDSCIATHNRRISFPFAPSAREPSSITLDSGPEVVTPLGPEGLLIPRPVLERVKAELPTIRKVSGCSRYTLEARPSQDTYCVMRGGDMEVQDAYSRLLLFFSEQLRSEGFRKRWSSETFRHSWRKSPTSKTAGSVL